VTTREPRKEGLIGDLVQKVLLGTEKLPSVSLQYLFSADRSAHHEELVLPSLQAGKVVITDRCFWSAIVYGILDRSGGEYDKSDAQLDFPTVYAIGRQGIAKNFQIIVKRLDYF
jgi:dTMP kinase